MQSAYAKSTVALVLALGLSQPALAARGDDSHYVAPTFNDLDVNRDGILDPGEVQGRTPLYGQWQQVDENGDGAIERSEFAAFEIDQE